MRKKLLFTVLFDILFIGVSVVAVVFTLRKYLPKSYVVIFDNDSGKEVEDVVS